MSVFIQLSNDTLFEYRYCQSSPPHYYILIQYSQCLLNIIILHYNIIPLYNLIFATCNITLTNTLHQAKTKCFSWLYVCNVLLLLCCSCRLKLYNITFIYFPFWSLRSVYLLYSGYIQVTSLSYSTQQSTTIIIIIIIIIIITSLPYYHTQQSTTIATQSSMLLLLLTITAYFGVLVLVFLKEEKVD